MWDAMGPGKMDFEANEEMKPNEENISETIFIIMVTPTSLSSEYPRKF